MKKETFLVIDNILLSVHGIFESRIKAENYINDQPYRKDFGITSIDIIDNIDKLEHQNKELINLLKRYHTAITGEEIDKLELEFEQLLKIKSE